MTTKYNALNDKPKPSDKEYTTEDAIDRIGFGKFQLRAGAVTSLTWIADSMEVTILGILGPILTCEWRLTNWQMATYSSTIFISIAIFSPIIGALSDKYGRRRILMLVTLLGAYYGIISAFAPTFIWLVILRFCIGCVMGANPVSAVYVSEFLPIKNRGTWMAWFTYVSWSIGSVLGAVLAYALVNSLGWRVWIAASSVPLLFAAALVAVSRNTPRFSLVSGKWKEAKETLQLMAEWNKTTLPEGDLETCLPMTIRGGFVRRVQDLFSRKYRVITILTVIYGFCVQLSYYGTLMAVAQLISKTGSASITGGVKDESYSCSLNCGKFTQHDFADLSLTACAEFLGAVTGSILVEKLGRKWMMSLPMLIVGVVQITLCYVDISSRPYLLACLLTTRFCAIVPANVLYTYCSEVYPTSFRTCGVSAAFFTGRVGAALSPYVSQVLLNSKSSAGLLFLAFGALTASLCAALLPVETKGREMED